MKLNKLSLVLSLSVVTSLVSYPLQALEKDKEINWVTTYGSSGSSTIAGSYDSINDIENLVDNKIIAAGTFDGNKVNERKSDGALMLYDSKGNLQWEKQIGGSKADSFNAVTASNHGGYVTVGVSQSNDGEMLDLNKGGKDGVIAKFDDDGNVEKITTFGGSDSDELKDVVNTYDGGYVAVGYTHSVDGDLADTSKNEIDRDAVIIKYDQNLSIQWVKTAGGTGGSAAVKKQDEFSKVITCNDGGFLAVGFSNAEDGDLAEISLGGKDAFVVKFDEHGNKQWVKTYGGSKDDIVNSVYPALSDRGNTDRDNQVIKNNGYVLVGTTNSIDGTFGSTNGTNNSYILKIDEDGNPEWADTLENSEAATGEDIIATSEGYMITGTLSNNDLDFTGVTSYGKQDVFVAYYSKEGKRMNIASFGGNDKDTVNSIIAGVNDDYLVCGNTSSTDNIFTENRSGKYDGYLLSIAGSMIERDINEKYLVPVVAWKANDDTPSMMAAMLYKDAYVEKVNDSYQITVYFINANIMGSQVSASTLGDVSYQYQNEFYPAINDQYDKITQVKTTTVKADSLDIPILIHIEDAMGDIRLSFDKNKMEVTETPPYFAPVEVTVPDFNVTWKTNLGGSDEDFTTDMAVTPSGHLLVVGQTYSNDIDFKNMLKGASSAFIYEFDATGKKIAGHTIGGSEWDTIAYASSIDVQNDGYVVTGSYVDGAYVVPNGDFEQLNTKDSIHGQTDTFVAKYDYDHNLIWMKGFSGSNHDQAKHIKATADGGCLVLIETNSNDGDMQELNKGLFDLVVVKYNKDGNVEWQRTIGGRNIESAGFGLDVLANGDILLGGITSSGSGDFTDVDYYGDLFDLFVAKISSDGNLIWLKTYGGEKNEYGNNLLATADGGFVMTGNTKSTTGTFENKGTGYDNAFIIKCNDTGEVEWKDVIKSTENSEGISVTEINQQYYLLGDSRGTDFDFENLNKGSRDAFVATYSLDGKRTSLQTIGGSEAEYAHKIIALNNYQVSILLETKSNDGDYKDMNLGGYDGSLLTYDYQEKPNDFNDNNVNNGIKENDVIDKMESVVTGDDLPVVILAIMALGALTVFSFKIKKN